jgi:hypothetical protein
MAFGVSRVQFKGVLSGIRIFRWADWVGGLNCPEYKNAIEDGQVVSDVALLGLNPNLAFRSFFAY